MSDAHHGTESLTPDAEPIICGACGRGPGSPSYFDFSLRMNPLVLNDPCAICGHRTDEYVGLELFYETNPGDSGPVCGRCGLRFAPKMYALRAAVELQY